MKLVVGLLLLVTQLAFAAIGPYEISAEQVLQNHDDETTALQGHAQLTQGSHKLSADKIIVNKKSGTVLGIGNCAYDNGKTRTESERMLFRVSGNTWIRRD